jgi:uncharacterized protein YcbK (DUF882 family)
VKVESTTADVGVLNTRRLGLRIVPLAASVLALATAPGLAHGEGAPRATPAAAPKPAGRAKPTAPKTAARAPAPSAKRAPTLPGPIAASRGWHAPTPGKTAPLDAAGRPMLTLRTLNMPDHVTIGANSERGGFAAEDLDRAAHILRDPRTGNEHPVDPRVLDLVYRVAVHFSAHEVRIVSGYRTPKNGSHSNHGKGRAIDLVVPGASDEEVARFARDQGFVGVGVYPTSGFVHLDVRERSYFWVDYSGPGKRNRTRGILGDLAAKSDARALARGEHGIGPFAISTDVDAALAATRTGGAASNTPPFEDDDNDEGAVSP